MGCGGGGRRRERYRHPSLGTSQPLPLDYTNFVRSLNCLPLIAELLLWTESPVFPSCLEGKVHHSQYCGKEATPPPPLVPAMKYARRTRRLGTGGWGTLPPDISHRDLQEEGREGGEGQADLICSPRQLTGPMQSCVGTLLLSVTTRLYLDGCRIILYGGGPRRRKSCKMANL